MPEFGHGLIIGKFYPLHAGHSALIRAAEARCARVTVQLLGASVESIPLEVRADWIRQDHPTVALRTAMDDAEIDFHSDAAWDEHMAIIEGLLDAPVDAVFSSDEYGEEMAARLGAAWVQVDKGRAQNPYSGTAVRADLVGTWGWLSASVRASLFQRVVVLGAESTGSTTLAEAIAADYGTAWVPEFGRHYSGIRPGGLDAPWRTDEFELVAGEQLRWEEKAARESPHPLIVCDTDMLATVLWHERYVGTEHSALRDRALAHPPLLYLLTGDEIPFVQDGMRDGEHIREAMQQRFREELAAQPVPWIEVRGSVAERLVQARAAIDAVLQPALQFAEPLEHRSTPLDTLSP
jgi:HTH-type transcriptional regulator, transcriptional repressor of NAD biosynthesis genes